MANKTNFDDCINEISKYSLASEVSLRKIGNKLAEQVDSNEKLIRKYEPKLTPEQVRIKAHEMAVEYVKEKSVQLRTHELMNTKVRLDLVEAMKNPKNPSYSAGLRKLIQQSMSDTNSALSTMINSNPAMSQFVQKNKRWVLAADRIFAPGKMRELGLQGKNIIREMYGEDTKDPVTKEFVEALKSMYSDMHGILERHGLKIPKVEDFTAGRRYSYAAVAAAKKDGYVKQVLKNVSVEKMNKHRAIALNSEAELADYAARVWDDKMKYYKGTDAGKTPVTSLGEQLESGVGRKYFFKSADDEIEFMEKFGANTVFQDIIEELESLSREVAMIRRWGPDPHANFRYAEALANDDMAKRKVSGVDKKGLPKDSRGRQKLDDPIVSLRKQWNTFTGLSNDVANPKTGEAVNAILSTSVAKNLGSMVYAMVGDIPTQVANAKLAGIGAWRILKTDGEFIFHLGPKERLMAARMLSVGLENLMSPARLVSSLGDDVVLGKVSKTMHTLADAVIRMQGALKIQKGAKDASAYNLNMEFAEVAGVRVDNLPRHIKWALNEYDITDKDWAVISSAEGEVRGKNTLVSRLFGAPEEFVDTIIDVSKLWKKDPEIAIKFQSMITEMVRKQIIEPSVETRAVFTQGAPVGSFARSMGTLMGQFKSFGVQQMLDNIRTTFLDPRISNRAVYAAKLSAGLLVAGTLQEAVHRITKGKEIDLTNPDFWIGAGFRGNGFGIAMEPLSMVRYQKEYGTIEAMVGDLAMKIAGPGPNMVYGAAIAALQLGIPPTEKTIKKALKWANKNYPGQNLWYKNLIQSQLSKLSLENFVLPDREKKRQEAMQRMQSYGLGGE